MAKRPKITPLAQKLRRDVFFGTSPPAAALCGDSSTLLLPAVSLEVELLQALRALRDEIGELVEQLSAKTRTRG